MKALYEFFTPIRRFIINISASRLWMDACCHFGIHQDEVGEEDEHRHGVIIHYCPNPRCQIILWENSANDEKNLNRDPEYNWTLNT